MFSLPKVEEMLERQARLWDMRQRQAAQGGEAARRALAHLDEGPWICVSRQIGSGGTEFTRRVADKLGWQVYDREILSSIAEHTHTRETVLSRLDERAIQPLLELVVSWFDPQVPGSIPFHQEVARVVVGLAKKGNAIIVGRGANWLLDDPYGLRVRLVAPVDQRAERIARRDALDPADARRKAEQVDASQRAFIRQVYKREIDDPVGYDLVLNTGSLDVDTAADLTVTSLYRKLGLLR